MPRFRTVQLTAAVTTPPTVRSIVRTRLPEFPGCVGALMSGRTTEDAGAGLEESPSTSHSRRGVVAAGSSSGVLLLGFRGALEPEGPCQALLDAGEVLGEQRAEHALDDPFLDGEDVGNADGARVLEPH